MNRRGFLGALAGLATLALAPPRTAAQKLLAAPSRRVRADGVLTRELFERACRDLPNHGFRPSIPFPPRKWYRIVNIGDALR